MWQVLPGSFLFSLSFLFVFPFSADTTLYCTRAAGREAGRSAAAAAPSSQLLLVLTQGFVPPWKGRATSGLQPTVSSFLHYKPLKGACERAGRARRQRDG